jgi:hypothetical protein
LSSSRSMDMRNLRALLVFSTRFMNMPDRLAALVHREAGDLGASRPGSGSVRAMP